MLVDGGENPAAAACSIEGLREVFGDDVLQEDWELPVDRAEEAFAITFACRDENP